MSKIKSMPDRVIVEQSAAEEKEGKIIIPEQAKRRPAKGTVVAVGADVSEIKVGNVVWYEMYQAIDVEHDGKEYKVLKKEHLLAVEE